MKPMDVRKLTEEEIQQLKQGLQSESAFTMRRCQILLKSQEGKKAQEIAREILCSDQTVREAINSFAKAGMKCLIEKSHARHDKQAMIDEQGQKRLVELIKLSPRSLAHETSVWTREMLSTQIFKEGYTSRQVSVTLITNVLQGQGIRFRRAKHWIHSPDVHYERRKKEETS